MFNNEINQTLNFVISRKAIEYISNKKTMTEFIADVSSATVHLLKVKHNLEVKSPVDVFETRQGRNAYRILVRTVYNELNKNRK
jgi:hypothetical protein